MGKQNLTKGSSKGHDMYTGRGRVPAQASYPCLYAYGYMVWGAILHLPISRSNIRQYPELTEPVQSLIECE